MQDPIYVQRYFSSMNDHHGPPRLYIKISAGKARWFDMDYLTGFSDMLAGSGDLYGILGQILCIGRIRRQEGFSFVYQTPLGQD